MIHQSGEVLPSPKPLTFSLLLTRVTFQVVGPQASLTVARSCTSTILWFGGQRVFGTAVKVVITGGTVSTTVTVVAGSCWGMCSERRESADRRPGCSPASAGPVEVR